MSTDKIPGRTAVTPGGRSETWRPFQVAITGGPPLVQDPNDPDTLIQVNSATEVFRMDTDEDEDVQMEPSATVTIDNPPQIVAQWPSLYPRDVERDKRRTAKKQARRQENSFFPASFPPRATAAQIDQSPCRRQRMIYEESAGISLSSASGSASQRAQPKSDVVRRSVANSTFL